MDWERQRLRFRTLRERRGLSQDNLAAIVGKSGSAISQMENGVLTPRLKNLVTYCKAIDTELMMEIVPKEDAELMRRLAGVLPYIDPDTRALLHQAIKAAEAQARRAMDAVGVEQPRQVIDP